MTMMMVIVNIDEREYRGECLVTFGAYLITLAFYLIKMIILNKYSL